jgi:hypothetical protein
MISKPCNGTAGSGTYIHPQITVFVAVHTKSLKLFLIRKALTICPVYCSLFCQYGVGVSVTETVPYLHHQGIHVMSVVSTDCIGNSHSNSCCLLLVILNNVFKFSPMFCYTFG